MHSVALPSPDYMPGPKNPPSPDYVPGLEHPPSPVYVHKPEYPKYLVPSGDEAPIEDQHLPADALLITLSPDYPSDDDDNDDDDTDDEDVDASEDEDDDEEEHLAPFDSFIVLDVDHVSSVGDTEAFKTDEAWNTVRLEPPMSASMEARIAEHVAAPTPPLSVSSPPLPLPLPLTISHTDAGEPLGYMAAGIRIIALLLSTSYTTDISEVEMSP
nr:hypothetical protein [Tanacetum cinerariifolium]